MNGKIARTQWPTPSFDRPDTMYYCEKCADVVDPDSGDKQAALLIAGSTRKLCGDCAQGVREDIMTHSNEKDANEGEQLFERIQGRTVIEPPVPGYSKNGLAVVIDLSQPPSEQIQLESIVPDGDNTSIGVDPDTARSLRAFLETVEAVDGL